MKDRGYRNWAKLPPELTSLILLRLGAIEILQNAQRVCRSWRLVCKEPSMWRKIDMRNDGIFSYYNREIFNYNCDSICFHAVDRSEGGLVDINLGDFGSDSLLSYIAERSNYLRCFSLTVCYQITRKGIVNTLRKLPFLEELEISECYELLNYKAIGHSCPLLKTLKLNRPICSLEMECDKEALLIAKSLPGLRSLEIRGNDLTNRGLDAILDNCLHLEHLDLSLCFNVNFYRGLDKLCSERIRDFRR